MPRELKIALLLISSYLSIFLCAAQNEVDLNATSYLVFEGLESGPDSITITGIVLDRKSLAPILEAPIVNSCDFAKTSGQQRRNDNLATSLMLCDQASEIDGTFMFRVEPSRLKLSISSLNYEDVWTDWIRVKSRNLYFIILMDPRDGFH